MTLNLWIIFYHILNNIKIKILRYFDMKLIFALGLLILRIKLVKFIKLFTGDVFLGL
jgi:hypothetical protein